MYVHQDIIDRYLAILQVKVEDIVANENEPQSDGHLAWMLVKLGTFDDEGKAMRWLGYVQGILVSQGRLDVMEERNFTRPYFTKEEKTAKNSRFRLVSRYSLLGTPLYMAQRKRFGLWFDMAKDWSTEPETMTRKIMMFTNRGNKRRAKMEYFQ